MLHPCFIVFFDNRSILKNFEIVYIQEVNEIKRVPVKLLGVQLYEKTTFVKTTGIKNKKDFQEKVKGLVSFYQNSNVQTLS